MNVAGAPLSPRERQIAQALAGGESHQQIADRLNLAPSTMRTHLATIYRKLGVSTKLELRKQMEASKPIHPSSDLPRRPDKPSIAVLAFANMSHDPGKEYLSDAISADIISALSGRSTGIRPGPVANPCRCAWGAWGKVLALVEVR